MQFFPLYAIAGDGVNLVGRNWLSEVKLDYFIAVKKSLIML